MAGRRNLQYRELLLLFSFGLGDHSGSPAQYAYYWTLPHSTLSTDLNPYPAGATCSARNAPEYQILVRTQVELWTFAFAAFSTHMRKATRATDSSCNVAHLDFPLNKGEPRHHSLIHRLQDHIPSGKLEDGAFDRSRSRKDL
ncbi:hypothetical protein B0H11DRAFT_2047400 [Mycena galericulata]|nr:hypothetical protein B0H11DRAFT_2047400 [Mycena galericulata]